MAKERADIYDICMWCDAQFAKQLAMKNCTICGHQLGQPRDLCQCRKCIEYSKWELQKMYGFAKAKLYIDKLEIL